MEHRAIRVSAIHPNPHRDFKRNPIRQDQVEKIIDSIDRTGFWDNVVVRVHPDRTAEYQLAYGHSRLEAVKRSGITEVVLPVAEMSDWDMYCAMVDENETQQAITPAIAFENVESGIVLMERAFEAIGPAGNYEAFNRALGRSVQRCTDPSRKFDGGFEKVRNAFFRGEGIGRVFILETLPQGGVHGNVISEVLNSHYGEQRAKAEQNKAEAERKKSEVRKHEADAKHKQADAERKEAEAKRKQAEVEQKQAETGKKEAKTKDAEAEAERKRVDAERKQAEAKRKAAEAEQKEAEARRLQEEAEEADRKAEEAEAEAKRIGGRTVDSEILLAFKTPHLMTAFAKAISEAKVSKDYHRAAMEYAIEEDLSIRKMSDAINLWWYQESGQQEKDRKRHEKEEAVKRFQKQMKGGDFETYLLELGAKVRRLTVEIKPAIPTAPFYSNEKHRTSLIRDLEAHIAVVKELIAGLAVAVDGEDDLIVSESVNPEANGAKGLPSYM